MFQALTGIIAQNSYSLNRLTAPEIHKVSGLAADRIKPGKLVELIADREPEFTVAHTPRATHIRLNLQGPLRGGVSSIEKL
jgi:hypothetical protein